MEAPPGSCSQGTWRGKLLHCQGSNCKTKVFLPGRSLARPKAVTTIKARLAENALSPGDASKCGAS